MRSLHRTILVLGFCAAACGSAPVPAKSASDAKASISAAEAVGAPTVPEASLHLKLARDQAAQADALMADGDNEEAALVLERAKIDAELALALTKEAQLRAQADAAQKRVQSANQ